MSPCFISEDGTTPWEEEPGSRGKPWYELSQVVASDLTGVSVFCFWKKFQEVTEKRYPVVKVICWNCVNQQCNNPICHWDRSQQIQKDRPEKRTRIEMTNKVSSGVGINLGSDSDPESPGHYICPNPWVGGGVGGEFEDGP